MFPCTRSVCLTLVITRGISFPFIETVGSDGCLSIFCSSLAKRGASFAVARQPVAFSADVALPPQCTCSSPDGSVPMCRIAASTLFSAKMWHRVVSDTPPPKPHGMTLFISSIPPQKSNNDGANTEPKHATRRRCFGRYLLHARRRQ